MSIENGHLRRLDHVGFTVSDLERSSAWYTLLLGHEPEQRSHVAPGYIGEIVGYPDCEMVWALWRLPGGAALELIEYLVPACARVDMETYNVGNGHLCLECTDLEAVRQRLRGHAEFRSPEPVTITAGPCEGWRACYLRDPDGITVELSEPPPATGPGLARSGARASS